MKKAIIDTEKGQMVLELFPGEAPGTVANFKKLTQGDRMTKVQVTDDPA